MGLCEDLFHFSNSNTVAIRDLSSEQERHFSYKQLVTKVSEFALLLESQHEKSDNIVAIIGHNSFEFIACYYGILAAGKTAVLIHPKNSQLKINEFLNLCQAKVVFTDLKTTYEGRKSYSLKDDNFSHKNQVHRLATYLPERDGVIFFTSGSTGQPKGVVRSYSSEYENAKRRVSPAHLKTKNISLLASSLCHNHALSKAEAIILEGSELVLMDHFDVEKYLNAIEKFAVTNLTATPSMFQLIVSFLNKNKNKNNFDSVQMINLGAERLPTELIEDIKIFFKLNESKILSRYGGSEFGANIFGPHPNGLPMPDSSVGFPRSDVKVRIINKQLQIHSHANFSRYLNSNEKNIFTDDGYFITKDLFRINENGFYFFLGRADDCIMCGSESLFPLEIEKILDLYPDVTESVVVPISDQIKNQKPIAFILSNKPDYSRVADIKKFVIERIRPNAHPRQVWFVRFFPRTQFGKVDRVALTKLAEELALDCRHTIDYLIADSQNETL